MKVLAQVTTARNRTSAHGVVCDPLLRASTARMAKRWSGRARCCGLINAAREAREQQAATAEVLRVISSSPGDLPPVFAAILEKAVRICQATFGNIYRWDGREVELIASYNVPAAFAERRCGSQDTVAYNPIPIIQSRRT